MNALRLILGLIILLAGLVSARGQTTLSAETPRPEALARAEELLATAEATLALGGPDQTMAALVGYEQAAAWAAEGRGPELYARARLGKALCLQALGRPGEAIAAIEEALATARAAGLRQLLIALLDREAELAEGMGLIAEAVHAVREAALLRDEQGLVEEAIEGFLRLARLELARDGGRAAAPALQAALERAREAALPAMIAAALEAQVELALATGDVAAARLAVEELIGMRPDSPGDGGVGPALVLLGRTLAAGGEASEALPILLDAALTCAESGEAACESDAREVLSATLLELERPRDAVQEILALIAARRNLGDLAGELRAHFALVRAFRQLGRLEPALSALSEAERLASTAAPASVRAALRVEKARLLSDGGEVLEAAAAWDEALAIASEPEGDWPSPDAPTRLLILPERELLLREQLDTLVETGLWARALLVCANCLNEASPDAVSLEGLREMTLSQDATLLTWRGLDDSLLGWALMPDGRLLGARVEGLGSSALSQLAQRVQELAPRVPLEPAGEGEDEQGGSREGGNAEAEELRMLLRRLHDALIGPLEQALPKEGRAILVLAPPELRGFPWGLLIDEDGVQLGERHGLAEPGRPARAPRARGGGALRVVADLRDPEHPGMDVRRLAARLDGLERQAAYEEAERLAAAEPRATSGRSRSTPGRRREEAPAPQSAQAQPLEGERVYSDGLVVLAGAAWVPERLQALAAETAVLVLHANCADFEAPELHGAFVLLPSCHGPEAESAASLLLAAGARSVLVLRWDPGPQAREALASGLVASIDSQTSPAATLSTASRAGLPSTVWASLRLLGAAR